MIAAARPIFTTTQSPTSITLSSATPPVLTDSATLSGGYSPTGTITFKLYGADGRPWWTRRRPRSAATAPTRRRPATRCRPRGTVTGTYQWDASYSGDGNNNAVSDNRRRRAR